VTKVACRDEAVATVVARPCGARRVSPRQLHARPAGGGGRRRPARGGRPRRTRLQAPGRA
jgi:hypothetical protein